jgi:hypothetical protein
MRMTTRAASFVNMPTSYATYWQDSKPRPKWPTSTYRASGKHPLKGDQKGVWAIAVRANWRVTFRVEDRHITEVDYLDYH